MLSRCQCGRCGAPAMVAFAGKRQFMDMCNVGRKGKAKLTRLDIGLQRELPQVDLACASPHVGNNPAAAKGGCFCLLSVWV